MNKAPQNLPAPATRRRELADLDHPDAQPAERIRPEQRLTLRERDVSRSQRNAVRVEGLQLERDRVARETDRFDEVGQKKIDGPFGPPFRAREDELRGVEREQRGEAKDRQVGRAAMRVEHPGEHARVRAGNAGDIRDSDGVGRRRAQDDRSPGGDLMREVTGQRQTIGPGLVLTSAVITSSSGFESVSSVVQLPTLPVPKTASGSGDPGGVCARAVPPKKTRIAAAAGTKTWSRILFMESPLSLECG